MTNNIDKKVVDDFGNEWDRFQQADITYDAWNQYFHIFIFS